MTRPDRKANRAVLSRLKGHLAEATNGDEPKGVDELPVDARSRIAIQAVKDLYAKQTEEYQQSLRAIAEAAIASEGIDRTRYNYLDIDKMVWQHREKA